MFYKTPHNHATSLPTLRIYVVITVTTFKCSGKSQTLINLLQSIHLVPIGKGYSVTSIVIKNEALGLKDKH